MKKYSSLITTALDGVNPFTKESVLTERSVIISLGNFQPTEDDENSFYYKLLKECLSQTDFRVAQLISPAEFDQFCGRFHG